MIKKANQKTARVIREKYATGDCTQLELANEFDLSQGMVSRIINDGECNKNKNIFLGYAIFNADEICLSMVAKTKTATIDLLTGSRQGTGKRFLPWNKLKKNGFSCRRIEIKERLK